MSRGRETGADRSMSQYYVKIMKKTRKKAGVKKNASLAPHKTNNHQTANETLEFRRYKFALAQIGVDHRLFDSYRGHLSAGRVALGRPEYRDSQQNLAPHVPVQ